MNGKPSRKYLLRKLAEEAAEVIQAAMKVIIHGARKDLMDDLEGEVGDLLAIIAIMRKDGHLNNENVSTKRAARVERERGKA